MAWTRTEKEWIDLRFKGLEESQQRQYEDLKDSLGQILEQVTRTNGRVTSLERSRVWTKGAAWGFGLIIGAFIFLVAWIGKEIVYETKQNSEFRIQHQGEVK
jgi:hypothetical protein